ncbi:MAG: hypothetical protein AB7O28_26635 [Vicinamibacterales bacterium]
MTSCRRSLRRVLVGPAGLLFVWLCLTAVDASARMAQVPGAPASETSPLTQQDDPLAPPSPMKEVRDAIVRLPLAAVLGTVLALRPRKRGQGRRSVLVVQTQIMLAVVGAVIMLVVGNSLSRAFGIVGAAGLVRYRSTIDDPKEAVVMLCALGAGLASGVGLYILAPFATFFMATVLWAVEYFEPPARKYFELAVTMNGAPHFRPKVEGVLHGLGLEYELLTESDETISYSVNAPLDVRTRDVSDTMRLLAGDGEMAIEWSEKKARK